MLSMSALPRHPMTSVQPNLVEFNSNGVVADSIWTLKFYPRLRRYA